MHCTDECTVCRGPALLQPEYSLPQRVRHPGLTTQCAVCCGHCSALYRHKVCRCNRFRPVKRLALWDPVVGVIHLHCCMPADCMLPCIQPMACSHLAYLLFNTPSASVSCLACCLPAALLAAQLTARQCVAPPGLPETDECTLFCGLTGCCVGGEPLGWVSCWVV